MKTVVQSVKNGALRIVEAPTPQPGPTEVLVATTRSVVSVGTERAVRALASASLLKKARARPDLVRQVVAKARAEGIGTTRKAVQTRLQDEMQLGYSAAGRVVAVGDAVSGVAPGDRVATASAGHGDYQVVPGLLAVKIPDHVDDESAAFAAVAAIAIQGLRQADVAVGGSVAVIGLGIVGQLTVRVALAAGLSVIAIDLDQELVDRASAVGAIGFVESGEETTRAVLSATRGNGVDAVIVTAATPSSEPAGRSTEILRDRGRLVIVGDVGLDLKRTPFYEKEIDIRFARSYGPGRYERTYEEFAIDYPIGHVRWTEGRNMESYLDLLASNRLQVADLITHTFDLDNAISAYDTISGDSGALGVQFTYPPLADRAAVQELRIGDVGVATTPAADVESGLIGAGAFTQATLLPAFAAAGLRPPLAVTSSGGISATRVAERFGIGLVVSDAERLVELPNLNSVFITSRHDSHASLTTRALGAGKHVFVEKPLALSEDELADVLAARAMSKKVVWVGFNRRHSTAVKAAKRSVTGSGEPLLISYRVNAGKLPETHWYHDRRQGGRLLGEVCHFVDTASWIIGLQPTSVVVFGDSAAESLLNENLTVVLRYPDGSTASILYSADGSPRTSKEQIDILGRGKSMHIDNFTSMTVDGSKVKLSSPSKGHAANLAAFRSAVRGGEVDNPEVLASIETTKVMLAAARSLATGQVINV
jgi:predicted dehydrogenase/threonine dehydrogenase-like Zn-dependent dehydrogenase